MELNPHSGHDFLIGHIPQEGDLLVRLEIASEFRLIERELMTRSSTAMGQSIEPAIRQAGDELAGWVVVADGPNGLIWRLATEDPSDRVREPA